MDKLWVVGVNIEEQCQHAWIIRGIFSRQADAEAICVDNKHWVGAIEVDTDLGSEVEPWPNAYYPNPKNTRR